MHRAYFFVVLVLWSAPICAQWFYQQPCPTGNIIEAVKFIDDDRFLRLAGLEPSC